MITKVTLSWSNGHKTFIAKDPAREGIVMRHSFEEHYKYYHDMEDPETMAEVIIESAKKRGIYCHTRMVEEHLDPIQETQE